MKFINFPEDFKFYRLIGVVSLPQGFWAIALIKKMIVEIGERYQVTSKSLLVWPDGKTEEVDVKIRNKSDNLSFPGKDTYMDCVGDLKQLNKFGIKFRKYNGLTDTSRDNNKTPSELGEIRGIKFRGVSGSSSQAVYEPDDSEYISGVIDLNSVQAGNKNSNKVALGSLPDNPGIGFRRGEGRSVFINPDESKKWLCSCLSIDELTCLAVHETGGCILDNPLYN